MPEFSDPVAHFHAVHGEHEVSIEIDPVVVHGALPPIALRLVLEWARLHKQNYSGRGFVAFVCFVVNVSDGRSGLEVGMKPTLLALTLLATNPGYDLIAQATGSLIGTWRLVSASTTSADGKINAAPYGANPIGFLTYSPDGRMTAIISNGGRTDLSIADRITAPANERAQAFATFLAYAGRYTVQGGKVTHHIEAASIQNWVNGDQVRLYKLDGDHLTVLTPPDYLFNGQPQTFELKWQRVK